ncbi:DUF4097 domain-containing protein [Pontibacter oryzae]|nr:DUF4097 domain-containing protein [Pontibacter oryzae]
MHKYLLYLLVLALAPTLALAQNAEPVPCPEQSVVLDLSELRELANLEDLSELKQLAVLESPEYPQDMKDMVRLAMEEQTGDLSACTAAYDVEKRKVIEKSFKVTSKDILSFENEWGKVHVNTWDKNEVQVRVDVIARAGTEAKAQEVLNNIKVVESRSGNTYSFRTKREPMRISNNDKSMEINYTIYMPANNAIAVKNSFGDVYLASLKGKADIDISYGSLKCDRLANSSNNVKLSYSSGSCTYINGGNLSIAFSSMKVDEASGLQGHSKYSDFKVGNLEQTMEMDLKYGSFKIDNISKNIQKISLDSGFTPVSLNFADNTAFNFDVNVQFGNFNVDKSLVTITSHEKSYTSAEYKGRFGGASPKGLVSITSKYGDVKFTK